MKRPDDSLWVSNMTEFFKDSVEGALRNQQVETTAETEFYLVNLLEDYAHAERLHGVRDSEERDEPLALTLGRALNTTPTASIPLYKRIGDLSLYVSGFFSRSLERRPMSRSYYYDMGRNAYDTLSVVTSTQRNSPFSNVFGELADKFARIVEVLIEISETHAFRSSNAIDALFERWARATSAQAGQSLVAQGALPLWRPGAGDDFDPN